MLIEEFENIRHFNSITLKAGKGIDKYFRDFHGASDAAFVLTQQTN